MSEPTLQDRHALRRVRRDRSRDPWAARVRFPPPTSRLQARRLEGERHGGARRPSGPTSSSQFQVVRRTRPARRESARNTMIRQGISCLSESLYAQPYLQPLRNRTSHNGTSRNVTGRRPSTLESARERTGRYAPIRNVITSDRHGVEQRLALRPVTTRVCRSRDPFLQSACNRASGRDCGAGLPRQGSRRFPDFALLRGPRSAYTLFFRSREGARGLAMGFVRGCGGAGVARCETIPNSASR
jgi:hypothetical protein